MTNNYLSQTLTNLNPRQNFNGILAKLLVTQKYIAISLSGKLPR